MGQIVHSAFGWHWSPREPRLHQIAVWTLNGFGENRVADEITAVLFAEYDQIVHIKREPEAPGKVAEPIGARQAADWNRIDQFKIQRRHRFLGASEFFPGERNPQALDDPFHDAARPDPKCGKRQTIETDKRQIAEKMREPMPKTIDSLMFNPSWPSRFESTPVSQWADWRWIKRNFHVRTFPVPVS